MRIHRLEMQAFGPFADRQAIDFDELGANGLFLLNGPTGAGKTSVLDAICYALYGVVPGVRQGARRLRSDHADPATAPEVVCEFSVGSRRLEVARSPQWERPAKRAGGRGTVTEQAHTLLREYVDGDWIEKSNRNDEASEEIRRLLGMDREQFTRVVMLPQGDFAAFLRADAATRAELLQQLFGTSRFEEIERQLREELNTATERLREAEAESEHVLRRARDEMARHQVAEPVGDAAAEAGTGVPAGADAGSPADSADSADSADTPDAEAVRAYREDLERRAAAAEEELGGLRTAAIKARDRLQEMERLRARSQALLQLERDEQVHAHAGSGIAQMRTALGGHARAQALAAYVQAADSAASRLADASGAAAAVLAELAVSPLAGAYGLAGVDTGLPVDAGDGTAVARTGLEQMLTGADARISADLAAADAAMTDEQRLGVLETEVAEQEDRARGLSAAAAAAGTELEDLRNRQEELSSRRREVEQSAGRLESAEKALQDAQKLVSLIGEYRDVRTEADSAAQHAAELRSRYQDLRQEWQDLLQSRLDSAAAELALALAEGGPCPVCGSCTHPAPAVLPDGRKPVTREQEQSARERAAEAERGYEQARRVADELAQAQAGLEARGADADLSAAQGAEEDAREELEGIVRAAAQLQELVREQEDVSRALVEVEESRSSSLVESAQLHSAATAGRRQADDLQVRVAAALEGFDSISARAAALRSMQQLVARATAAVREESSAAGESLRSSAALQDALRGSDFEGAAAVRAALLPEDVETQYREQIGAYDLEESRLQVRREAEDAAAADSGPMPVPDEDDIAVASEAAVAAGAALEECTLRVRLLQDSVRQLEEYMGELTAAAQRIEPLRSRYELLKSVADTARGAGENGYRMTLSTYVLAARLEQVAAAATERLLAMTAGRYTLVHSDQKAGNRRSGLGLHVTDEWTGQHRDTSTLSGGESFMASLALALGLADVVQQEAGGTSIETLFVDEGFGSLDETSLEQVMDALEGLRDGGRVVGLVSHVAEMKLRIPAQLQIVKGRSGSTIHYRSPAPLTV